MRWSYYNLLFQDQRFGFFLYNSLSNSFFELDHFHHQYLQQLKNDPQHRNKSISERFLSLMRENTVLINEDEEDNLLMMRQQKRNAMRFDVSRLDLSICPTLSCNFRCPYCFESTQQKKKVMSSKIIEALISFVNSFDDAKHLSITWYGGEPTLAFDIICKITKRFEELDIDFEDAGLVTNGYHLDDDKIVKLNELNIKTIQITLDGPEKIHNSRRMLAGGRPTFRRIMDNIDTLMNSSYEGNCSVRVNIDKNNIAKFFELKTYLLDRYKGKNFLVYAGNVEVDQDHAYDQNCKLCADEWSDFTVEMHRHDQQSSKEAIYPDSNVYNICTANSSNGFVIGPEGELYKCWEDVGIEDMVIGSILDDEPIFRQELVAQYSVGTDPYLDEVCQKCKVLPICGGGCAKKRLKAKYFNGPNEGYCSLYKDNMIKYLMEYYDGFLTADLCADMLNQDREIEKNIGYRLLRSASKM